MQCVICLRASQKHNEHNNKYTGLEGLRFGGVRVADSYEWTAIQLPSILASQRKRVGGMEGG